MLGQMTTKTRRTGYAANESASLLQIEYGGGVAVQRWIRFCSTAHVNQRQVDAVLGFAAVRVHGVAVAESDLWPDVHIAAAEAVAAAESVLGLGDEVLPRAADGDDVDGVGGVGASA